MFVRAIALAVLLSLMLPAAARADFAAGEQAYRMQNWIKAIAELRPLAEQGDQRAQLLLGNMYNDGDGVIKNPAEAFRLYKKSAAQHNTEAMIAIAAMHQQGIGVKKDAALARAWFGRAASLGNQGGAFFYAVSLSKAAEGTEPDLKNAYKWFTIASKMAEYAKVSEAAAEMAGIVGAELQKTDVAAAHKEAVDWKPVDPATLGPLPGDEAPKSGVTAPRPAPSAPGSASPPPEAAQ